VESATVVPGEKRTVTREHHHHSLINGEIIPLSADHECPDSRVPCFTGLGRACVEKHD